MRKSDPELNKKIGERIKQCRMERNMSRSELGEKVNLTGQHIYNIETGRRGLSLSNAHIFSRVFDVDPDYLLCETDWAKKEDQAEIENYILEDFDQMVLQLIDYVGYHRHGLICRTNDGKYFFGTMESIERRVDSGQPLNGSVQYFVFEHENQLKIASAFDVRNVVYDVYSVIRHSMEQKTDIPALVPGFETYSKPVGEHVSYSVDKEYLIEQYKTAIQCETQSSEIILFDKI